MLKGFSGGSDGKESACFAGDEGSIPGSGRSPGEGNDRQPTPIFLPGKSHGQRSLAGYSLQGHKESDTTEQLHFQETVEDRGAWRAAVHGVAKSQT